MISLASHTPLYAVNLSLRRHGLRIERTGALITVHDEILAGLSFSLPVDAVGHQMAALAVEGANRRREFILGTTAEKEAA